MPFAVIFPGQGAATPGAGRPWRDHPAWHLVTDAETATDTDLAHFLLDADAEELASTRASQLAALLVSLMADETLRAHLSEAPVAMAGHSLGQITALASSRTLTPPDSYRLAVDRANVTQDSADRTTGRMAALVGADLDTARQVCDSAGDAWVANLNAPGQVVIAGTPEGLDAAAARAKELGLRRTIGLKVGHAFHTPLLADAAEALRPTLEGLTFHRPEVPVVANTDAAVHEEPSEWPDQLQRHLTEPVRWIETQHRLVALGADTFVEAGPGKVLAGMARRTVPDVAVVNIAVPDDLGPALEALAERRVAVAS